MRPLELATHPFILMSLWGLVGQWGHPEDHTCVSWKDQCPASGRRAGWDGLDRYGGDVALPSISHESACPHPKVQEASTALILGQSRGTITVSLSTGNKGYGYHWILRMKMGPLGGAFSWSLDECIGVGCQ